MARRDVVKRATALGAAGLLGGPLLFPPTSASAAEQPLPAQAAEARKRPTSPNGWELVGKPNGVSPVWTRPVPGTGFGVPVRIGDVETVLVHVVRRFHYEIAALREGDVAGWRAPSRVDVEGTEGNQASGTAVAIRPGSYPLGSAGGFFRPELLVIRDILAECNGIVRWSGDDHPPYEALFSIDVPPGDTRLRTLATTLRGWATEPGSGAGKPVDVTDRQRRKAAKEMERRQKALRPVP
ncbi:twin-arginine translocation signal domain-containing protein [Streptomyces flaveolus]